METGSLGFKVFVRSGLCLCYLLVVGHVVKFLGLPSRSTPARVWTACRNAVAAAFGWLFGREQAPAGVVAGLVRMRLNEFKLRQCLTCIQCFAHAYGVFMFVRLVLFERQTDPYTVDNAMGLVRGLLFYAALLIVSCECVTLTVRGLDVIYAVQTCLMMSYVIMMENDSGFFLSNGMRVVMRTLTGICYLDHKKSCWWNLAFTAVTCWRFEYNFSVIKPPEGDLRVFFWTAEAATCVFVAVVNYCVEKWLEWHLRLHVVAEYQSKALLRLLSFQCDAVLWLTPELEIDGPAPQFASFLLFDGARNHLDGREFQRYVADDGDRDRFRDFISTSTAIQGTDLTPDVLHLSLRDALSTTIPVDIFHVHSIDLQDRERHLIGIRENAGRAVQGQQPEQRRNEAHAQHHEEPPPQQVEQELRQEVQAQRNAHPPRQRDEQTGPSLPTVDENSSASLSTVAAAFQPEPPGRPQEACTVEEALFTRASEVFVKVDVYSRNLTMSQCTFVFESTRSSLAPGFVSMLPPSSPQGLSAWIQANVNCELYGNRPAHVSRNLRGLVLQHARDMQIFVDSINIRFPRNFAENASRHGILRLSGISFIPDGGEVHQRQEPRPIREHDELVHERTPAQSSSVDEIQHEHEATELCKGDISRTQIEASQGPGRDQLTQEQEPTQVPSCDGFHVEQSAVQCVTSDEYIQSQKDPQGPARDDFQREHMTIFL